MRRRMCLLVVFSRAHEAGPLVVAANRDEWLARPARPMERLSPAGARPRILGGRDLVAGGTWLAVNEHGVVASLTNQPSPPAGGVARDPSRRSRGDLPLRLAAHASAREAAEALAREVRAEAYSPCWVLVADRDQAIYFDLTGRGAPLPRPLGAGVHILENKPLDAPSAKVDAVRAQLGSSLDAAGLHRVLASHETGACVHAGAYGTRSSSIVLVPPGGLPRFHYTDGPPCTSALLEASWP
jgi:uncharacterized protein with NRDE domain